MSYERNATEGLKENNKAKAKPVGVVKNPWETHYLKAIQGKSTLLPMGKMYPVVTLNNNGRVSMRVWDSS